MKDVTLRSTGAPGALSSADMSRYAELAGPLSPAPDTGTGYRVQYRNLRAMGERLPGRTLAMALACLCFEIGFVVWLLQADHFPTLDGPALLNVANLAVAASIAVMEVLRLINVVSLAIASITIRNPVPVAAQPGLRIAFATTIVPSKGTHRGRTSNPQSRVRADL